MKLLSLLAMLSFAQHVFSQSITYSYDEAGNRTLKTAVSLTREMSPRENSIEQNRISIKKTDGGITVIGNDPDKNYEVSLYSIDGVLFDTKKIGSANVAFSLNDYPEDTYIVRIKDDQKNNIKLLLSAKTSSLACTCMHAHASLEK